MRSADSRLKSSWGILSSLSRLDPTFEHCVQTLAKQTPLALPDTVPIAPGDSARNGWNHFVAARLRPRRALVGAAPYAAGLPPGLDEFSPLPVADFPQNQRSMGRSCRRCYGRDPVCPSAGEYSPLLRQLRWATGRPLLLRLHLFAGIADSPHGRRVAGLNRRGRCGAPAA